MGIVFAACFPLLHPVPSAVSVPQKKVILLLLFQSFSEESVQIVTYLSVVFWVLANRLFGGWFQYFSKA